MQQKTAQYLAQHLKACVEEGESTLICFLDRGPGSLGYLMAQAVELCGGRPVLWGEDLRWKTLLRLAFTSRATTIIGPPLVVLGLRKLKKAKNTPLPIRNVVTAGYPCYPWMIDGIVGGFDCRTWECFSPGDSGVVAGFSCEKGAVHLWDEVYDLTLTDDAGNPLPPDRQGRWSLSPKGHPELSFSVGESCRLDMTPCACGDPSPRLTDLQTLEMEDTELANLAQYLLSWTSVLDFTLCRGPYGLEIEMVVFPGEKLPTLPTCARQVIRPWDPDIDEPFPYIPGRKNMTDPADSH